MTWWQLLLIANSLTIWLAARSRRSRYGARPSGKKLFHRPVWPALAWLLVVVVMAVQFGWKRAVLGGVISVFLGMLVWAFCPR
jgi:hypothetical protein